MRVAFFCRDLFSINTEKAIFKINQFFMSKICHTQMLFALGSVTKYHIYDNCFQSIFYCFYDSRLTICNIYDKRD